MIKLLTTTLACVLLTTSAASRTHTHTRHAERELHALRLQEDRGALEADLLQWKASPHAQEAKTLGVYTDNNKSTFSVQETVGGDDDELWRFALSKATLTELSRVHPDATFSTNTPFALLTAEEFSHFVGRGGLSHLPFESTTTTNTTATPTNHTQQHRRLADHFDWSEMGCVAPAKNQGGCGSCSYFAAAAALESAKCIFEGGLTLISEQFLLSCFPYGYGCSGAWFNRIIEWGRTEGVCTSADCPYNAGENLTVGSCSALKCTRTKLKAVVTVEVQTNEDALLDAVATQPVAVSIAAGNSAWQYYSGGVLESCPDDAEVDHAVLTVGYGHDQGLYWKLKNSWGAWWGEKGFLKLRRGVGGACRIVDFPPHYPAY